MIWWILFFAVCFFTIYKLLQAEFNPSPARQRRLFNSRQKSRGYK